MPSEREREGGGWRDRQTDSQLGKDRQADRDGERIGRRRKSERERETRNK